MFKQLCSFLGLNTTAQQEKETQNEPKGTFREREGRGGNQGVMYTHAHARTHTLQ